MRKKQLTNYLYSHHVAYPVVAELPPQSQPNEGARPIWGWRPNKGTDPVELFNVNPSPSKSHHHAHVKFPPHTIWPSKDNTNSEIRVSYIFDTSLRASGHHSERRVQVVRCQQVSLSISSCARAITLSLIPHSKIPDSHSKVREPR